MKTIRHYRKRIFALTAALSLLSVLGIQALIHGNEASGYAAYFDAYRRPETIPEPPENELTPARELLGRTLFFDPLLSGANSISCASCHNPGLSWGDGLPRAVGHGMTTLARRTPTILNLAWAEALFWDGRSETLEAQCLGPIQSNVEMNQDLDALVEELAAVPEYAPLFEDAYPGEGISETTISNAIAVFERTIVSGRAPFDEWIDGDESALSPAAKRGFVLFNTTAKCAECHSGWRFTDDSFHDIGVPGEDVGRAAVFEGILLMEHAFKTPTLRNVDRRYPYMHDGSETTLEDVIDLYVRGGRVKRPSLSPLIVPLELSEQDKTDLVAFMKSLTSQDEVPETPTLPR